MKPEEAKEIGKLTAKVDELARSQIGINESIKETNTSIRKMSNAIATLVTTTEAFEKMRVDDNKRMDSLEIVQTRLADKFHEISKVTANNKFIAGMAVKIVGWGFVLLITGCTGAVYAMIKLIVEPMVAASMGAG